MQEETDELLVDPSPHGSISSRSSSYASSSASSDVLEASPADLDRPFVLPDILAAVPLGRSVERDLLRMVGVPAPATRLDLEKWAEELTEAYLVLLLANVQRSPPCSALPPAVKGTRQWDDASAIGLYTYDSPIYRVINGYLSEPNTTLRSVSKVAPMVRRIYEAVQRLGKAYLGPAFRVIKACKKEGSAAMQAAYAHYFEYFAVGRPIDMQQFTSFTTNTEKVSEFAENHTVPVIVLACGVFDGFDIRKYSIYPDEDEVLCLPPARFRVLNPPVLIGTTVVVGVETLARAARRRRAASLFVSSLGPVPAAATTGEPIIARDALLHDAETGLRGNALHRYVFQGPTGVGKTHLAYRVGQRWLARGEGAGQPHHVRWFAAGSRDLLLADYRTFLEDCFGEGALSESAGAKKGAFDRERRSMEDLLPAVRRLIASTPNVLLIFDGVEDEAVVDEMLYRLLMTTERTAPNLHVLMTSSSSTICDTGVWVALQGQHLKEVPVFTNEEATSFLTQSLPQRPEDITSLQQSPLFRTHVHNHPKRLQWVSALLRNNPTMGVAALEACLEANVARGTVDPVFTAVVDALIAQCTAKHTKGWEMLRVATLLADAPIPVNLLRESMELTDDEADNAIQSLTLFSLVTLTFPAGYAHEYTTPCVVLHSLARDEATRYDVHYSTSASCDTSSPAVVPLMMVLSELLAKRSMGRLCYPHATHALRRHGASVLTHGGLASSINECDSLVFAVASLLSGMGHHMYDMCNFGAALDHGLRSCQVLEQINPTVYSSRPQLMPLDRAISLTNIAEYHGALGNTTHALEYAVKALEIRRAFLHERHPDIAISLNAVGMLYLKLGQHDQAHPLLTAALELRREVLPDPHLDTASSLLCIGSYHSAAVGDHKLALQFSLEALDMQRKVLSEPDSAIATSLNSIGKYHSLLGNQREALRCTLEGLEMMRSTLPEPHALIAGSCGSMSRIFRELGDPAKALHYQLEALKMCRQILPDPHPDIAFNLSNIGSLYSDIGDHEKALQYALEALKMMRKVLPQQHPDIALCLKNIGSLYGDLGDRKKALQYALEALEMMRKVLPDPHPDIATCLKNTGSLYGDLGDHKQALQYDLKALEMMRKLHPDPHPDIATLLHNVGASHGALGDKKQALQYTMEALDLQRQVLPNPHSDIAMSILNAGINLSELGDHKLALQYAFEALEMRSKLLSVPEPGISSRIDMFDHGTTSQSDAIPNPLPSFAAILHNQNHHQKALTSYIHALNFTALALRLMRKAHPDHHQDIALSLKTIGQHLWAHANRKQALQYTHDALDEMRRAYPDPHQDTATVLDTLATYYIALGNHKQALQYALEALEMQRSLLPEMHLDIAHSLHKIGTYYSAVGCHNKALRCTVEALELMRMVLPEIHPHIANSLNSCSTHLHALGFHKPAVQYSLEAVQMLCQSVPERQSDFLELFRTVEKHSLKFGFREIALECRLEILAILRTTLPHPCQEIVSCLCDIENYCSALGDHNQALKFALEALEMRRKLLPGLHRDIANSLNDIATYHTKLGDETKALEYTTQAQQMRRLLFLQRFVGSASSGPSE